MFLSKRSNGMYYIFYHNSEGKRLSVSTKTKLKSEALTFLSNFSAELKKKEKEKTIPVALKTFLFEYLKFSEAIHSWNTTKSIRSTVNSLNNYFSDIRLSELNTARINEYLAYRKRTASVYVATRELAYISGAFNFAITRNYALHNPCKGIKKFKIPERQPVFFSIEDYQKLIGVIEDSDLRHLVDFALQTGCRQMELLSLRWEQVNFQGRAIILDNRFGKLTKSGRMRAIPLNHTAFGILEERKAESKGEIVFTYRGEPIKQQFISHKFRKLVNKAGINPKLSMHALRHTFATRLIQLHAPVYEVSKLLGHSSLKTTEIYTHILPDDLRQSVELLDKV